MIRYFTAVDKNYGWWAIHLLRSFKNNAPTSDVTCFILGKPSQLNEIEELKELLEVANPSARLIYVDPTSWFNEIDEGAMGRITAGYRTVVFSNRAFFNDDDTLIWVDADSIVRKDLTEVEEFCKKDFDVSARGKNAHLKFASGFIISKPTEGSRLFSNALFRNWKKRFNENEWTADQNAFNDAAAELYGSSSVIKAPRGFCDVWLSEEGSIWQAKHQTKLKKRYVDEMNKHRIDECDLPLWKKLSEENNKVVIDETRFSYKGIKFNFMGLDGEEVFEYIRENNSFYNVDFLEKLSDLKNEDATVIIGGGIQNTQVYLNAFTDTVATITFEPNPKMIDVGLRNGQNNYGASRMYGGEKFAKQEDFLEEGIENKRKQNLCYMYTNWRADFPKGSVEIASLGMSRYQGVTYDYDGFVWEERKAIPDVIDVCDVTNLRPDLYKKIRKTVYRNVSLERWNQARKYLIDKGGENRSIVSSKFSSLDEAMDLMWRGMCGTPNNRISQVKPGYDFGKLVGLLVISVPEISHEILMSGKDTIEFFKPHLGIVYVDDESGAKEKIIDDMLPSFYVKEAVYPDQLDKNVKCAVYRNRWR